MVLEYLGNVFSCSGVHVFWKAVLEHENTRIRAHVLLNHTIIPSIDGNL